MVRQGNSSRKKGFRAERELAIKLWEKGFAVIRAPASGSGARRIFYPDIVAIRCGRVFVFEVKTRANPQTITLKSSTVRRLREYREKSCARILLAVKLKGLGWKIVDITERVLLEDTVRVKQDEIVNATSLDSFIRGVLSRSLDEYG